MLTSHRNAVWAIVATAIASSLGLSGCALDSNPVKDLVVLAGVKGGEPKPAPDFVSSSRTGNKEYIPVGTDAPKPRDRSKTAQEVTGAEAELDQLRVKNEGRR